MIKSALKLIEPSVVKELVRLEPETGRLIWLPRDIRYFASSTDIYQERLCKIWNLRFSDKEGFITPGPKGYLYGKLLHRTAKAHLVVFALAHGKWPDGVIDHINGIPFDNRPENLRDVGPLENARNAKRRRDNQSGVTGVSRASRGMSWCAHIRINGASIHIGQFKNFDDAVAARSQAERDFGFHPNHGRAA
ncbi:MAG: HNH endonuclease [Cypionkella sp.]|uniref:HNH endonuclease n=1 Tax=Cypionkella sp. TaxID=2811411 RepID=UPI002731E0DB|nr:HNH endonuclease [Cypionkella sp.]MDP2047600.1 HNH endonuclease [Cypionkella sp.]